MTRAKFTLIEVVIALMILTIGLSTSLALASIAKKRMIKAQETWRNQHMLEQAAEYFLLDPTRKNIDQEIFPYEGFDAVCALRECDDKLPDGVDTVSGSWKLATATIKVVSKENNEAVKSVAVDVIVKDLDL